MARWSGYGRVMSADSRAKNLGSTGGLPGANAVPEASEVTPDEIAPTVAMGTASPGNGEGAGGGQAGEKGQGAVDGRDVG